MSDSVRPHRRQPTRMPRPWDSPGKNTGVGCHFLLQCMKVKSENEVAQSCLTLSDPMDCSLPGSPVHGIFQARVLEWGAIAFSDIIYNNYISLMTNIKNLFVCVLSIYIASLEKYLPNPPLAFRWVICFFTIELQEFFVYSEYQGLVRCIICRYVNLILQVVFSLS